MITRFSFCVFEQNNFTFNVAREKVDVPRCFANVMIQITGLAWFALVLLILPKVLIKQHPGLPSIQWMGFFLN